MHLLWNRTHQKKDTFLVAYMCKVRWQLVDMLLDKGNHQPLNNWKNKSIPFSAIESKNLIHFVLYELERSKEMK